MFERFSIGASSPRIEGSRVYLRPPAARDWAEWARVRAESRTFLTPWEPTWPDDALTRAAFRRRLRRHAQDAREDAAYAFLIFRRQDGRLVGGVTLSNVRRGVTQSCALGYWTGRAHARQGYMHDALRALIRHVFDDLGLRRLEAACLPHNEASRNLLLKLGFVQEGLARQYLCIDGKWQDHVLFALLARDPRP
ncbi:MAG: GNAT family N-acetyltransferase [Alphaproteobacteria bacterium]|nr:GNAT family N-acetyltransferase [Alphaproteobacteria bacterium]